LISDLSRQLASHLDQSELYGGGSAANQPTGLINVPGVPQNVAIDPANLHPSFCAVEAQIEASNISLDSYGVEMAESAAARVRSQCPVEAAGAGFLVLGCYRLFKNWMRRSFTSVGRSCWIQ